MRRSASALAALLLAWMASACIASSVVDSQGRNVAVPDLQVEWRPAAAADLDGYFESERIDGEASASLARVAYFFSPDGFYTGAALVLGGLHPEYQTLSGQWRFVDGRLDLGSGEPAETSVSGELLQLAAPGGTVVLRRAALQ